MKIIRNGEEIHETLDNVIAGDVVVCNSHEETVQVGRDLSYLRKHYAQLKPFEMTIL